VSDTVVFYLILASPFLVGAVITFLLDRLTPSDRTTALYLLLTLPFLLGGVLAFVFDRVTLLGRTGPAEFSGGSAHIAGTFCFLVAAYWLYKCLQEYRVSRLVLISPFVVSLLTSAALVIIKHG
jgi:hypothetical protein